MRGSGAAARLWRSSRRRGDGGGRAAQQSQTDAGPEPSRRSSSLGKHCRRRHRHRRRRHHEASRRGGIAPPDTARPRLYEGRRMAPRDRAVRRRIRNGGRRLGPAAGGAVGPATRSHGQSRRAGAGGFGAFGLGRGAADLQAEDSGVGWVGWRADGGADGVVHVRGGALRRDGGGGEAATGAG